VSESASRATLYVMAISSALVGLGYIGQVSEVGDVFGGAAVALALGVAVDASLGLAAGVGGAVAIASLLLMRDRDPGYDRSHLSADDGHPDDR
jgi:hypothetical protein